jgi:hypothetical protein
MAMRDDLRRIVDELPETDVPMALRILRGLRAVPATGPDLVAILDAAPADDEPWTDDDEAAYRAGMADAEKGATHSPEEMRRMLGL